MSLPAPLAAAVDAALAATTGARRLDVTPLGGGSVGVAARLDTSAGPVFLKYGGAPPADRFLREAEGLAALAGALAGGPAGALAGGRLIAPRPLFAAAATDDTPGFLLLEWLPEGPRPADWQATLGRGLAALHRATAPAFGFPHDNTCGATLQRNAWRDDWVDFYRAQRLGPLLDQLAARGLPVAWRRAGAALLERLEVILACDLEPPALIHGDLWSGNLHACADGRLALIDPAACYAHREAELGMLALFGGVGPDFYAAYDAAWPLQPGWRARLPVYTLYHLLNHHLIFGGGYGAQAFALVESLL